MEFVPLIIAGIVIPLFLFIFRKNFFVEIKDTNAGIAFFFNQLVENTVYPPGVHFLPQKIGPFWIHRIVIMPGRELMINIKVDTAYSKNVKVTIDLMLILQLKLTAEAHPTFDSILNLSRWVQLEPGESLFTSSVVNGSVIQVVEGKLVRRLASIAKDALSRVIVRYNPETITSTPQAYDDLVNAIHNKIWAEIKIWAQKLKVEVEHIVVEDEVIRTQMRLNAAAQADVILTEEQAQLKMDQEYERAFGKEAAFIRISGRSFGGSNFNVFSTGIGGLISTFAKINPEPTDITKAIPRRIKRRRNR